MEHFEELFAIFAELEAFHPQSRREIDIEYNWLCEVPLLYVSYYHNGVFVLRHCMGTLDTTIEYFKEQVVKKRRYHAVIA